MKRILTSLLITLFAFILVACKPTPDPIDPVVPDELDAAREVLYQEAELSFQYFWETSNSNTSSAGYGLSRDRYPGNTVIASIASVGFALASLPAGVENGWISYEEGYERARGTLNTLLTMERYFGFYFHFVNMATGQREWNSEISIIDTGLMIAGAVVAGEYFGGDVLSQAMEIWDGVQWEWYINPNNNMFYMGIYPNGGNFNKGGAWDHISEQLVLYVLAAGSRTYPTDDSLYKTVKQVMRNQYLGRYVSTTDSDLSTDLYYYTYDGSLFQHQFSHAFIDFRGINDFEGTNWFDNAVEATRAAYAYTIDQSHRYQTYSELSWGLSAGDGPGSGNNGYHAYGSQLAKSNHHNGTIVPYAAVASVNYLEQEALLAVQHYYTIPQLVGRYGLFDAYNLGPEDPNWNPTIAALTPWYDTDYIGIDKGITLLMIENYRSELIWTYFMQNSQVQEGLSNLGFVPR